MITVTASLLCFHGFHAKNVARVALDIQGKRKAGRYVVWLRRWSPIISTDCGDWAVFTIGRTVPARWRRKAREAAYDVCLEHVIALQQGGLN